MFIDAALRRACAVLDVKLTHSQPGRPAGRGKIERFFKTVRDQFLVEITDAEAGAGTPVGSLAELNDLLPGMTEHETRDYLTHHLKLVGRSDLECSRFY